MKQIHAQWRALKTSSVKDKIEAWIADWKNLRLQMISLKLDETFEDDTIFVSEFLRAEHKWVPIFCDNWEYQLDAAQQKVKFFRITRSYKNVVQKKSENAIIISSYSNAITLHDKTQNQVDQLKEKFRNKSLNDKFRRRKCVCDEMHLFRECFYIVITIKKSEWKKSLTIKNEARQRIFKNIRFQTIIKVIINIDILNELNDETTQKEDIKTVELNRTFKFDNVTIRTTKIRNSLSNNVIYDSDCNQLLTYDKARYIDEITSKHEWVDIPNESMLMKNYDTMRVNDKLEKKMIRMNFAKTTYILSTNMTLMSLNKLKNKNYVWDMYTNVLIHKTSG
jgi:hypothetical protein